MSARREREAQEAYLSRLGAAISCLTTAVLIPVDTPAGRIRGLALAGNPVRLRTIHEPPILQFQLSLGYTVLQHELNRLWDAHLASYRYELSDRDGREIFAFHWHPIGRSSEGTPHLHADIRHPQLNTSKLHFPTGIVPLPALIRCLITEFGVEPLRPDWDDILRES